MRVLLLCLHLSDAEGTCAIINMFLTPWSRERTCVQYALTQFSSPFSNDHAMPALFWHLLLIHIKLSTFTLSHLLLSSLYYHLTQAIRLGRKGGTLVRRSHVSVSFSLFILSLSLSLFLPPCVCHFLVLSPLFFADK